MSKNDLSTLPLKTAKPLPEALTENAKNHMPFAQGREPPALRQRKIGSSSLSAFYPTL
ncbi:hypothetical protein GF407_12310 [candidate division KSB1 bacterium]|nr:hypothetical protein [candidate division KSB1 bacterium]